ncbi:MAG: hypothetical protein ABIY52_11860, partial [Gemmatimonadaceae bacterium]
APIGNPGPSAPAAVSYNSDLTALANSIVDEKTARAAIPKVSDFESKISLPADKAALAFTEAKASMIAIGAEKGCRMMRLVRREQLNSELKGDLDDALKECGSP